MSERPSFWQRLFGGAESSSLSQRQQKVMRYLIERMDKGDVPLQQALQEDYVRRNLSRGEGRQGARAAGGLRAPHPRAGGGTADREPSRVRAGRQGAARGVLQVRGVQDISPRLLRTPSSRSSLGTSPGACQLP